MPSGNTKSLVVLGGGGGLEGDTSCEPGVVIPSFSELEIGEDVELTGDEVDDLCDSSDVA